MSEHEGAEPIDPLPVIEPLTGLNTRCEATLNAQAKEITKLRKRELELFRALTAVEWHGCEKSCPNCHQAPEHEPHCALAKALGRFEPHVTMCGWGGGSAC